jgi:general secretion pathway protein M
MSAIALPSLGPNRGRRLAITLLVALTVVAIAIVAVPFWLLHRHYDEAIAESLSRLDRYSRIASTRPAVAEELKAMRGKETRKFFLRSGAAALSAAEAQEAVRSLIEQGGGRLVTMQAPVTKPGEGHYRQMTANVQLTANIVAARKILNAIETNVPYLFVDNLTMRSQVNSNFKPAPGGEPEIFVQFDVSGYSFLEKP